MWNLHAGFLILGEQKISKNDKNARLTRKLSIFYLVSILKSLPTEITAQQAPRRVTSFWKFHITVNCLLAWTQHRPNEWITLLKLRVHEASISLWGPSLQPAGSLMEVSSCAFELSCRNILIKYSFRDRGREKRKAVHRKRVVDNEQGKWKRSVT